MFINKFLMSFELNQYYKPPLSSNQYYNDNADVDPFTLLGGQEHTPQGDDDIDSFNQSQNIPFDHSINITENLIDNEYSAAPAPLRPHNFYIDSFNSELNKENNKIKKLFEEEEKNDTIHNKFSFFDNPNFFEDKKNMVSYDYAYNQEYQEFDNENNINNDNNNFNIINDDDNEKEKIINYKETPFPKNFSDSNFNMNSKDAPVNGLGNSSSSQDTNGTSNNNIDITPGFCNNNNDSKENILDAAITNLDESNNNNENKIFNFTKKEPETKNSKNITKKTNNQEANKKNKSRSNRRLKSDSIRKKIKARFHKKLRNIINKKLKDNGSKMYFELFPQSFITNIKISHNKAILKLTMRELLKMYFGKIAKDREKVKTNKKVLDYLDKKENVKIKNGIDNFLTSSYADVIQKYMRSKYFEDDVNKLWTEGESKEYIDKYKLLGLNWVEFYMNQKI